MRLVSIVAASLLALISGALAHDTPQALVEALYAPYLADEIPEDQESLRSERLQALYDADSAATPEGELGALDFDPMINGQDFGITDFEIVATENTGGGAVVEVRFANFGEPQVILLKLVQEPDGWKLDNVASLTAGSEYVLSDILAPQ